MRQLKGITNLVKDLDITKNSYKKLNNYEINWQLNNKILTLIHYGKPILTMQENKNDIKITNLYFQSQSDINAINSTIYAFHYYKCYIQRQNLKPVIYNGQAIAESACMSREFAIKQGQIYLKLN